MKTIFMYDPILSEDDYRKAIRRFLDICDAEPGTPEHEEAIHLSKLMEQYENYSCYERRYLN
ncbi:MAG: hypothetical protein JXR22_10435 [Prolixibacteraceae bacterium]|nr:hypothetical protein [Prolixibacteraceae bacterium]